jgi:hypothetical protein
MKIEVIFGLLLLYNDNQPSLPMINWGEIRLVFISLIVAALLAWGYSKIFRKKEKE